MNKITLATSVIANWAFFIITILVAFIVSPIMVNKLGDEVYGVWVLMVSIGGYFTVLDFGINTALVRFLSKYTAVKEYDKAAQMYSSAFLFFSIAGAFVVVLIAILGLFFKDFFNVELFDKRYLYLVFIIVGVDLAINLIFGVLSGSLRGMQNFLELNIILIVTTVIKNVILVSLLLNGYSLLSLAILQAATSVMQYLAQYIFIKKKYKFLRFKISLINKPTFKQMFDYSIYSFLIAIALKVLFYTDSIVIGSMVSLQGVTFYAIPAMIVENLEKFIWAIIAVLIPIISSREAVGKVEENAQIYLIGTKYTLLLCAPVIAVLLIIGDDFIGLWMGESYAEPSGQVLSILLVAYIFSLSQLIAQGILKGISKHKALAYILCIQAVFNLGMSILLAPAYGIVGVAVGTAIPLLVANVLIIPYYTCNELNVNYVKYITNGVLKPSILIVIFYLIFEYLDTNVGSYFEVIIFSLLVLVLMWLFSLFFLVEKDHQTWLWLKTKKIFVAS